MASGAPLSRYKDLPAGEAFIRGLEDNVRQETDTADLEEFAEYRHRPADFAREVIGLELALDRDPDTFEILETSYQERVFDACGVRERVAWRSSHGTGKTTVLAILIIWWLVTRPFSRALILAPAFERQITKYLWPEIRKWKRKALRPLPIEIQTKTVGVPPYQEEWFALAVQATDPDKVEGGHGESLMVIGDEAKGLSQAIVNAMMGTQTDVGGERLYVLVSVPGPAAGPFWKCFGEHADRWATFHTTAAESAIVRKQWIEDMRGDYGVGSYDWVTRVMGNFFGTIAGGLYPVEMLEALKEIPARERLEDYEDREFDEDEGDEPVLKVGIDVAGAGRDECVVTFTLGADMLEQEGFPGPDPRGEIAAYMAPYKPWIENINIDAGGIGYYFVQHFQDLGYPVSEFNFGATAVDSERFGNAAAEQATDLWDRAKTGQLRGLGEEYRRTYAQLGSIQTRRDSKGRTCLVDKRASAKAARELTGAEWSSPDWFDSLLMAYAPPQDDAVIEAW